MVTTVLDFEVQSELVLHGDHVVVLLGALDANIGQDLLERDD
jgi:hypothetical protein